MRLVQANTQWLFAVVVGICLVAAAVGLADRQAAVDAPAARNAQELSTVFRQVTKEVLPSIVSITTRGKAVQLTQDEGLPFEDDDSPFGEFFKRDPQLREFFKRIPQREIPNPRGMGSGFVIDSKGIIMTNNHVVRDAEEVTVRLSDGREFVATDIRTDPRSDVAIVRIEAPNGLKAVPVGNSDDMEIGDWVLAVGSPFGLDGTVTAGIISAKGRGPGIAQREDFLQTDAAINPGNSGGPLLNLRGEVIGINTAISSRSGGYEGIGFAIPINMAHWVAQQLIEKGEVNRAYLGVTIQPVDSKLAEKLNAPFGQGAIVTQVLPDSPAADAKLQTGDVILEFNGEKVDSPRNLQGIVEKMAVGKSYDMLILRDGKRKTVSVTMKEMPKVFALGEGAEPEKEEPAPSTKENKYEELGLTIQELTPQLAGQLGFNQGVEGVLIASVETNSLAHRAGLRTGQVIEKVGTRRITSPKEFDEAVQKTSLKEGILLLIRSPDGSRFVVIQSTGKDDR